MVFCLCISVSDWRPVQGVPHFSPYGSWDRRQLPTPDSDKDKQKRIDGYMMETYWLPKENKEWTNFFWNFALGGIYTVLYYAVFLTDELYLSTSPRLINGK